MSETMPQELTLCALDSALGWREPDAGLVPPAIPADPEHDRTVDPEA